MPTFGRNMRMAILSIVAISFGMEMGFAGYYYGQKDGAQAQQAAFQQDLAHHAIVAATPAPDEEVKAFQEMYPSDSLAQSSQVTAQVFVTDKRTVIRVGDAWLEIPTPTP